MIFFVAGVRINTDRHERCVHTETNNDPTDYSYMRVSHAGAAFAGSCISNSKEQK